MLQASRRVLVVDDWEDLCLSMAELLRLHGLEVFTSSNPRAGIRAAMRWRPQAALIDLDFGRSRGFNGFHVCAWLKARMPSCRRIAHTGLDDEGGVARMYEAGFQDVLIKPASVERLISAISLASSGPLVERRLVQQETDATTREGGVWAKVHSVA